MVLSTNERRKIMTNHIDIHINENTHLFIPENKNAEGIVKEINK